MIFEIGNSEVYLNFFIAFSRIEAVWKHYENFYDWSRPGPKLKAISDELKTKGFIFKEIVERSTEVRYLYENPPKVQSGSDIWDDYCEPRYCDGDELAILLDKIRIVRNNLFHGGKWCSEELNLERDAKLVIGALHVIEEILKVHAEWSSKMPLV